MAVDARDKKQELALKALATYEKAMDSPNDVSDFELGAARDILDWYGGIRSRPGTLVVEAKS